MSEPFLFYKGCRKTHLLQIMASYVDDIAAALSLTDPEFLWARMKEPGWSLSEEDRIAL